MGAKKPSPGGILGKKLDFSLSKCRNQKAKTLFPIIIIFSILVDEFSKSAFTVLATCRFSFSNTNRISLKCRNKHCVQKFLE